ncbi:MAG TPA: PfkB family carbohydrate kinase [Spirochaetales bacterium]|nr:PfkB family carbohydrate kinase [Spirochaetales bacterium]HRY54872.1 PfkB family carbohydrate kinase [Spirochaetia bacterium]HRZ63604.1 PfkB family carbohydrate kinase [Spirochaetia bacterium]
MSSESPCLVVCLNPVIQKTLAYAGILKGEVNRSAEHRVDASGKGVNVARVLTQSGRRAIHLTQAGGPTREWFLSLCAADGLELRWVESGSEIRFCYTIVDRADGTATELVEEAQPVAPGTGALVLAEFDRALPECGAVVISGTKAPGFEEHVLPEMARRAKAAGKLLVLDIKGADLRACLPFGPDLVKPNLAELLATWPLADPARAGLPELRAHVAALAARLQGEGGSRLVVTRGPEPAWYWDGGALREEPARACAPLNPTGSGDAFTAGLAAVLSAGGSMAEAVAEGMRLGARNAELLKPGSIL